MEYFILYPPRYLVSKPEMVFSPIPPSISTVACQAACEPPQGKRLISQTLAKSLRFRIASWVVLDNHFRIDTTWYNIVQSLSFQIPT